MAENTKATEVTEVKPAPEAQAQKQQNVWVCDQIDVVHSELADDGIYHTIRFVNFAGLILEERVRRERIFFEFQDLLKELVAKGFAYNVALPNVATLIQARLAGVHVDPKKTQEAIKARQGQEAKA
ncbi:MAG TPA: hypothetical protein DCW60_02900 [Sutterella sp.]|nr:hypothetical protein [Sutterella sp.]